MWAYPVVLRSLVRHMSALIGAILIALGFFIFTQSMVG